MSRKSLPKVSPSETEILRIIWKLGSASVQQVCDSLPDDRAIAYATVQTLLRRLEKKGYLAHSTSGKAHVFRPAVRREDVIKRSVNDFVERLFGGDAVPLVQCLAEHGQISGEDLQRLAELIEKK